MNPDELIAQAGIAIANANELLDRLEYVVSVERASALAALALAQTTLANCLIARAALDRVTSAL